MNDTVEFPSKTLTINIEGITYAIKFPNNKQFLSIENEKNKLSNGNYESYLFRQDNEGFLAKLIVDTIATFSILIPSLLKDLNVGSYLDLDLVSQNKLTKVYLETYNPWKNSWMDILSNPKQFEVVKEGESNINNEA